MKLFKPLKLGVKMGYRHILRSKTKLALKSIEIFDENISTEILSFLKYNHITDDNLNSYFYIIFYECFYLSVLLTIKEKKEHKEVIQSSIQSIIIYYLMKCMIIAPVINTYENYLH